jgi:hypothetical protein
MAKCFKENCSRQASMTCARCGEPVCDIHSIHGRFCTDECYDQASFLGWGKDDKTGQEIGLPLGTFLTMIVIAALVVTFLFLGVAGVQDKVFAFFTALFKDLMNAFI